VYMCICKRLEMFLSCFEIVRQVSASLFREDLSGSSNLQNSKVPRKDQAHGTSLFASAVSNQRSCRKGSPEDSSSSPEGSEKAE